MKKNEYTTGGTHPPKSYEVEAGKACSIDAASTGTTDNQPNVKSLDPGSHNAKGANGSAK